MDIKLRPDHSKFILTNIKITFDVNMISGIYLSLMLDTNNNKFNNLPNQIVKEIQTQHLFDVDNGQTIRHRDNPTLKYHVVLILLLLFVTNCLTVPKSNNQCCGEIT